MIEFTHAPHPHIEARKDAPAPSTTAERDSLGFNGRLGAKITSVVGTMWAAYAFALLTLVSLPAAVSTASTVVIVAWIAQTFLQLVLLPVIIVGQNVQGRAADKRAEQTYNDAEAILHECLQLQDHLHAQDKILAETIDHLRANIGPMTPEQFLQLRMLNGDAS